MDQDPREITDKNENLKNSIIRGGLFLIIRQGLGTIIGLTSVLVITKLVGPYYYGVYASALGVAQFTFQVAQLGLGIYLIRGSIRFNKQDFDQVFSLFIVISSVLLFLSYPISYFVSLVTRIDGVEPITLFMIIVVILQLYGVVPLAKLEQSLKYSSIAKIELIGQMTFLLSSLLLAFITKIGAWIPTLGWLSQQVVLVILYFVVSKYRPTFVWETQRIKSILGYGISYSISAWIWQLKPLVNSLIVGRFAGAESVGIVSLCIKMIESLGFIKNAVTRVSISAFAKAKSNLQLLVRGVEEGTKVQIFGTAPLFLLFSILAKWGINTFLGQRWAPVNEVLPFIAFGGLAGTMFSLQSSALYVLNLNWDVAVFHTSYLLSLALSTFVLVPNLGAIGYGWAEIIATSSYLVLYRYFKNRIGQPKLAWPLLWGLCFGMALFWDRLGFITFLPLLLVLSLPSTWKKTINFIKMASEKIV